MEDFISASHDVVFKALFVDHKDCLRDFLRAVIDLPLTEQDDVDVLNPELYPDVAKGKSSRLDIHVTMPDKKFNVEMQSRAKDFSSDRVLFYWSKMFTEDIESGSEYQSLDQAFSVNVLGFSYLTCEEYHSSYSIRENTRYDQFSDKLSIHILELTKLPKEIDGSDDKQMWLRLIKAEDEEALEMVRTNTQNPMIHKAIDAIYELNADKALREQIRQRDKALRDYENDMSVARSEGKAEGIGIGRAEGIGIGRAEGIGIGEAKNLIENVKVLMTNTQKPLAEVLTMLGITREKYDQSLALLNQ